MCASGRKHCIIIYSKNKRDSGEKSMYPMGFKTDRLAAENLLSGV